MSGSKKDLKGVLGVMAVTLGVVILIATIGRYEATKRIKREVEQRDRFAQLEQELPDLDKLRRMTVLYKERPQPLDTMARSVIREISGSRSLYGVDCTLLFCSMAFDDDFDWANTPLFMVRHGANKDLLGVESVDKRATAPQIRESEAFGKKVTEVREKYAGKEGAMPRVASEILRLRAQAMHAKNRYVTYFKIVPPTEAQRLSERPDKNDWHLPDEAAAVGYDPTTAGRVKDGFRALGEAWRARDNAALDRAVDEITAAVGPVGGDLIPSPAAIDDELRFNRVKPFVLSSWFFGAAAVLAVFGMAFSQRWLRFLALAVTVAGLGVVSWGFYQRIVLGFLVAITNLYESMIAVAVLAALGGFLLDVFRRSAWATAFGGLAAFSVLQVVDLNSVKFDDGISGPMAVLANNIWIHIHVPVVMSAYAFYFIAFLISLVALPSLAFGPKGRVDGERRELTRLSEISVNLGTVFMVAGLVLGGIWADVSWGRFWGWDPKETWGLILCLWFIVIIHGRFTKWLSPFWNAWMIFAGGNVLLWTYYGTNELLSGLHSYASSASEGGFWSNFIHERNRWFVWSTCAMAGISIASALFHVFRGGRSAAPEDATGATTEAVEPQ